MSFQSVSGPCTTQSSLPAWFGSPLRKRLNVDLKSSFQTNFPSSLKSPLPIQNDPIPRLNKTRRRKWDKVQACHLDLIDNYLLLVIWWTGLTFSVVPSVWEEYFANIKCYKFENRIHFVIIIHLNLSAVMIDI